MKRLPYTTIYRSSSFLESSPQKSSNSPSQRSLSPTNFTSLNPHKPFEINVTISSVWQEEEGFPFLTGQGQAIHRIGEHHIAGEDQFPVPEFSGSDLSYRRSPVLSNYQTPQAQPELEEEERDTIDKLLQVYKQESKHQVRDLSGSEEYMILSGCKDSVLKRILIQSIEIKFKPNYVSDLFRINAYNQIECPRCLQCGTPLTKQDLSLLFPQFNSHEIARLADLNSKQKQNECPSRKILEKVMMFDLLQADSKQLFEWQNKDKLFRKLMGKLKILEKSVKSRKETKKAEAKLKQEFKKSEKYYCKIVSLAKWFMSENIETAGVLRDIGVELLRVRHQIDRRIKNVTKR